MKQFILKIELGNDAMRTGADVAGVLSEIANFLRMFDILDDQPHDIRDLNGNKVGQWEITQRRLP